MGNKIMKTLYPFKNLLLVFVIGLCGISCSENIGGQATSSKVITGKVTDIENRTAVLHGKINVDIAMYDTVQFGFMISESKESLKNRNGKKYEAKTLIGQEYKLEIALSSSTKYYYCAWLLLNGVQYEFGRIKEFDNISKETFPTSGYVDLGLSVKWNAVNEGADSPNANGDFYDYDRAVSKFGNKLPTYEQFEELEDKCTWKRAAYGYKVTGPNGKSIFLPLAGFCDCDGNVYDVDTYGVYWSSAPYDSGYAWGLFFRSSGVGMSNYNRCSGLSVRLVQK